MENICRICDELRPRSAFTEQSFALHTCKTCRVLHHLRTEDRDLLDEVFSLLNQSRISKKDTGRLEVLSKSKYPKVALHGTLVLEIALLRPYKRGRLIFLEQKHPDLYNQLEETGLAYPQVAKRAKNNKYQKTQY